MTNKINVFIKKYVRISFWGILMLIIKGCGSNSPSLVNDNNAESSFSQGVIIRLDELDEHTPAETWERFFTQRGAKKLWEAFQQKGKEYLILNFMNLTNSAQSTTYQVEEITKGIIHYLSCYQLATQAINLKYKKEIDFTEILGDMCKLTTLDNLDLSHNQLTKIPSNLSKLTRLTRLDLSSNEIITISPEIGNLENLQVLIMSGNKLKQLPQQLGYLTQLHNLNLSYNQFEQLPSELGKLNLNTLKIHRNQIIELPSVLGNLSKLEILDLSFNQLASIPPQIGNFNRLRHLNLLNNKLTAISSEIGNCSSLENLNLSKNQLTEIPAQIANCSNLKYIDLSENQLTEIPVQIGKLTRLTKLILSYNKLKILPGKLSNLASLKEFNISSNQLTSLPASIIPKLLNPRSKLALNNNPWQDPTYYKQRSTIITVSKKELEELRAVIYKRTFPHRLLTLCIYYIKTHKQLFNLQELKNKLPAELRHFKQLLNPAYHWNESKDIICFKMLQRNSYIPFYLDFPLITPQNVEDMLNKFKEETFYHISSVCSYTENPSKEAKKDPFV